MIHVEKFAFLDIDDLCANAYIVSDSNNDCVIIDPSVSTNNFINCINKNNLNLKAILLTHGHFDHIRGVNNLLANYQVPLYINHLDDCMLLDSYLNGSKMMGKEIVVDTKTVDIKDNDALKLLEDEIRVIHTPFHTKGSVCYYFVNNKLLFSGDTLFKNSIGRDDLPNASPQETDSSLKKLKNLPKECKIYPGHGANTIMADELNYNYFLSR